MLESLIYAYRHRVYDWDLKRFLRIISQNKKLFGWSALVLLLLLALAAGLLYVKSTALSFGYVLVVVLIFYQAESFLSTRYRLYVEASQSRLEKVTDLLKTTIPQIDLFTPAHVDMLVTRLSSYIEASAATATLAPTLNNFIKPVALPIAAFIAGAYASRIGQLDPVKVITWVLYLIVLLALCYGALAWMRRMEGRSRCAAAALREDLLDIKLLYFSDEVSV